MTMSRIAMCIVCAEESDEAVMAVCFRCGDWYHLNPFQNRPGKDCGIAAIGDEETGIDYYCQLCLEEMRIEMAEEQRRQNMLAEPPATPSAPAAPPARAASPPPRRRFRRIDP